LAFAAKTGRWVGKDSRRGGENGKIAAEIENISLRRKEIHQSDIFETFTAALTSVNLLVSAQDTKVKFHLGFINRARPPL
jgi:hypothetical protein